MLARLLLFASFTAFAQDGTFEVGNVVYPRFGTKRKTCADPLDSIRSAVRANATYAQLLFDSILKAIDEQDPARVQMHLDATNQIWEWKPLDKKVPMQIRFSRDRDGNPLRAYVVRNNYLQDLILTRPEWVQELDDELRRRRPVAETTIVEDLEMLRNRPLPTAGLLL